MTAITEYSTAAATVVGVQTIAVNAPVGTFIWIAKSAVVPVDLVRAPTGFGVVVSTGTAYPAGTEIEIAPAAPPALTPNLTHTIRAPGIFKASPVAGAP